MRYLGGIVMRNLTVGSCLKGAGGICSIGEHRNYMCPYMDINKCPCSIPVTEPTLEEFKNKGCITSDTIGKLKYNPL